MTLTHIRVPIEFYALKLNEIQRVILSLAYAFRDKGLKMSNVELSKILGRGPTHISEQISKLQATGLIEIKNAQSKYRRIYFQEKPKVRPRLLSGKAESKSNLLSGLAEDTFGKSRNISKGSKEYVHSFDIFWKSYPKRKAKGDARKAWAKLKPTGELLDTIITGAKDVARRAEAGEFADLRGKFQFCKNPATWLNAEGWADESEESGCSTRDITEDEADELFKEVL